MNDGDVLPCACFLLKIKNARHASSLRGVGDDKIDGDGDNPDPEFVTRNKSLQYSSVIDGR